MNISFAGQITKKDFEIAYQLAFKNKLGSLRWLMLILMVICSFLVIFICVINHTIALENFLLLVVSITMIFFIIFFPKFAARNYDKDGNEYRYPVHGTITDEGLFLSGKNSEGIVKWPAYTHYICSKDTLLLFRGSKFFNIFKKDLFSTEQDWDRVLDFLENLFPVNQKKLV